MKIRSYLAPLAFLVGVALAPGLSAQELLTNSSSNSTSTEYSQLITLLTTFGNNLSSRDTATELNDSPNLISSSSNSNALVRSDERLGFFNWLIKDNFNKDKWNVFDNKEWVDAGIPEYGFIEGFSSQLSQLILQTEGSSRLNLNTTADDDKNEGEFQF